MKTIFDNQDFLNRLNPNVDTINKLKTQRNIAIGCAIIFLLATCYLGDRLNERDLSMAKLPVTAPDNKKI